MLLARSNSPTLTWLSITIFWSHRWLAVPSSFLVQLSIGSVYAFSMWNAPLTHNIGICACVCNGLCVLLDVLLSVCVPQCGLCGVLVAFLCMCMCMCDACQVVHVLCSFVCLHCAFCGVLVAFLCICRMFFMCSVALSLSTHVRHRNVNYCDVVSLVDRRSVMYGDVGDAS